MKRPNFIIVGAPKCGTTALSEYLRAHPNVFVSDPKEPHYFAEDFDLLRITKTEAAYHQLFAKATSEHAAVGEASTGYLYSRAAIPKILEYEPKMKLIVMLRNPIELVHAWHAQRYYAADEDEPDFERAWRLRMERREGRSLPRRYRHAELLDYEAFGKLGEQVERAFGVAGKEKVHVILFDDFRTNTKSEYEKTLRFLGLKSDGRTEFPRVNENRTHRFRVLGEFTQRPPWPIPQLTRTIKAVTGFQRLRILEPVRELNRQREARAPISAGLRAELADSFRDDVRLLGQLIGRDLSAWLAVPNPARVESSAP